MEVCPGALLAYLLHRSQYGFFCKHHVVIRNFLLSGRLDFEVRIGLSFLSKSTFSFQYIVLNDLVHDQKSVDVNGHLVYKQINYAHCSVYSVCLFFVFRFSFDNITSDSAPIIWSDM